MHPHDRLLPRCRPGGATAIAIAAAFALALLLPGAAHAQARGFRLDPVHTRVLVGIDHAGYSTALGTVSGSQGLFVFDPGDWSSARLDVSVPLERLDFGDAAWNRAAQRMLGAAAAPEARFISERVAARGPQQAEVCGTLYLHNSRQPLCLDVRFNQLRREPMPPFHERAGFSATASLSRGDFGIDDWKQLVGDTVELRIEAEALADPGAQVELEARGP
jgi:polyisoprenoid-binding protein YceI